MTDTSMDNPEVKKETPTTKATKSQQDILRPKERDQLLSKIAHLTEENMRLHADLAHAKKQLEVMVSTIVARATEDLKAYAYKGPARW